jgi:hypothetical protein
MRPWDSAFAFACLATALAGTAGANPIPNRVGVAIDLPLGEASDDRPTNAGLLGWILNEPPPSDPRFPGFPDPAALVPTPSLLAD